MATNPRTRTRTTQLFRQWKRRCVWISALKTRPNRIVPPRPGASAGRNRRARQRPNRRAAATCCAGPRRRSARVRPAATNRPPAAPSVSTSRRPAAGPNAPRRRHRHAWPNPAPNRGRKPVLNRVPKPVPNRGRTPARSRAPTPAGPTSRASPSFHRATATKSRPRRGRRPSAAAAASPPTTTAAARRRIQRRPSRLIYPTAAALSVVWAVVVLAYAHVDRRPVRRRRRPHLAALPQRRAVDRRADRLHLGDRLDDLAHPGDAHRRPLHQRRGGAPFRAREHRHRFGDQRQPGDPPRGRLGRRRRRAGAGPRQRAGAAGPQRGRRRSNAPTPRTKPACAP